LVFGGFTSSSLTRNNGWTRDDNAFIFSFNHSSKLKIKEDKKNEAIFDHGNYLVSFGSTDIVIHNDPHNRADNFSNLGSRFELPAGFVEGLELSKSYLAGTHQFKVKQIEVY
jgi:hypothetical protein